MRLAACLLCLIACSDDSAPVVDSGLGDARDTGTDSSPDAPDARDDAGTDASDASADVGSDARVAAPSRLVVFYTPFGVQPDWFNSTGTETDFTLSPALAPLAGVQSEMIVVDGIDLTVPEGTMGSTQSYPGVILTGAVGMELPDIVPRYLAGAPSLEQLIVAEGDPAPLLLSLTRVGRDPDRINWVEANTPAETIQSPAVAFETLFRDALTPEQMALRSRLADGPETMVDGDAFPEHLANQFDLITAAFEADVARIVTLQLLPATGNLNFPHLGIGEWHEISHDSGSPDSSMDLRDIWIDLATRLGGFVEDLAVTPAAAGSADSLLDHTLVVWLSETGAAVGHRRENIPVVLIGNVDGQLNTGRLVRVDRPHQDLLLTIGQLYNPSLESIGDPTLGTGPITELLAP